jgi:dTDP-4-amino-4,6-dideoxygalactose transaminase
VTRRTVLFNDLTPGDDELSREIEAAIRRVVASARYVLGPEVEAFEDEFCRALGLEHGVGVASGTDALSLSLLALGIEPGDEVITSPLTAAFTALAISRVGARPVFADVEEDFLTISPESVEAHITPRTKAIIPVHLYGNACAMDALMTLAERHSLDLVEDACQAHGGRYRDQPLGGLGQAGAFSFYPTKNLGALGDGGFVATRDAELAASLKRSRNGGQSSRYVHETLGFNSRLDELQAAVLRAKLPHLERGNERRREISARYETELEGTDLELVSPRDHTVSARHLFVVKAPARDALMTRLNERGVQSLIHYPIPVHLQPAYRAVHEEGQLVQGEGSCPVAEAAASSILSLPLYPSLQDVDVDTVIAALREVS